VTVYDLRSASRLTIMFQSHATCTFRVMCNLKHPIFPELLVLQRFKAAKVTFSLGNGARDGVTIGH